ncbi:MAG: hypothetical protein FWG66_01485, partial [Spirochaetes bacterium]|nr:hypothetical protein [Spirochaetota bacterium]
PRQNVPLRPKAQKGGRISALIVLLASAKRSASSKYAKRRPHFSLDRFADLGKTFRAAQKRQMPAEFQP